MERLVRVGEVTQVFQIQMLVAGDKLVTLDAEGVHQKIEEVLRHGAVVDEAADVADLAFLYFFLQLGYKVGAAGGVVNQDVSVAGDLDAVAGVDVVAGGRSGLSSP